jgi:hypothetical protein
MIGQNLYYLNNKKYVTNITNLDTCLMELRSYYHTSAPRSLIFVHPSVASGVGVLVEGQYTEHVNVNRREAAGLVSFMTYEEVTVDFIQNSTKCILIFGREEDQIAVWARYVAGLLTASNFYPSKTAAEIKTMTGAFIEKCLDVDLMFTYMKASTTLTDVSDHVGTVFAADDPFTVTYQNGKNFSYDLLFWLNDFHTNATVQGMIKEKFTVHQSTMAQDVMEHFTSRRHYMAYVLSVIDWMNANGMTVDKAAWVQEVYIGLANRGNYTGAFYKMEELWDRVKDNEAFILAHTSKRDSTADGWEYWDLYTEFKNVFPIVRKVLQNDFDMDNLADDLRLINTDVQFFSKRQNRIPYLIHKYPL